MRVVFALAKATFLWFVCMGFSGVGMLLLRDGNTLGGLTVLLCSLVGFAGVLHGFVVTVRGKRGRA